MLSAAAAAAVAAAAAAVAVAVAAARPTCRMWGGKLYFTTPDGDYVCAAQFVSKNVVLTAAQCLQDDKSGDYYDNMQFVQELPGRQEERLRYRLRGDLQGMVPARRRQVDL